MTTNNNGTRLSRELKPVFRALTKALGSRLTTKMDLAHAEPKLAQREKDFVGPDIDKGVRSDLIRLYILKNDTHTVSLGFSFKKESTDGLPDVVKVSVKGFNHSTQRLYFKQLGMFEKEEFTNRINSIIGHENFPNCSNNRIATIFKDTFSQKFSQRDYPT